jgi:hypothetical protein
MDNACISLQAKYGDLPSDISFDGISEKELTKSVAGITGSFWSRLPRIFSRTPCQ